MAINETEATANRTRWGGILIAIGALISIIAVAIYVGGVPIQALNTGTAEQQAQATVNARGPLTTASMIGVFGDLFLAAGAVLLLTRIVGTPNIAPAGWALAAIAFIGFLVTDALSATAIVPAAQAAAQGTALFVAVKAATDLLFSVSFLAIGLGVIGIYWGETQNSAAAIPKAASYLGVVGGVVAVIVAAGFLAGNAAVGVLAPVGFFLPLVITLYLGVRLGMQSGTGTSQAVRASAKG
jgi:hypothetical protein